MQNLCQTSVRARAVLAQNRMSDPNGLNSKQHRKRRGLSTLLLLGAALSVSACSTTANLIKPTDVSLDDVVPVQADWAEYASDTLPTTDWVQSFGDKQLSTIVAMGQRDNPSIRRAVAQLESSFAQQRISRADLYPQVGFSSRVSRNEGGTGFFAGSTSYSVGFNASWEVDVFGRVRDQVTANGAAIQASDADVAALRLSIASQIASAWFDAIEADLLVDLSARDIATQRRSLRLTERRFENGLTGSSDVRLARSNVANSQALEQSRLQNRDATIRNLQTLMRAYPNAQLDLPERLPDLPQFEGAGAPQDMLRRRPDVIAAEARIVEAGLNVDVARKALYPSLSLTSSVSDEALDGGNSSANLLDVLDLSAIAYSLAASVTAPLFQGGRIRAQIDAREQQLAAQFETYAETVLSAYREVENALDAEDRLRLREEALQIALEEAQFAERRLETRYVEGLATILQLLDAQSRRLNAEGQLIGAQAERLSNRVRLHVALGGNGYIPGAEIIEAAEPENQIDAIIPDTSIFESLSP